MKKPDEFIAKSNGETIRQHTDNLIKAFDSFKCLYGYMFDEKFQKAILYACEYHDYGKASLLFQKNINNKSCLNETPDSEKILKIYKDNGFDKNIPHGYLSPAFMSFKDLKKDIGELLTRCICNAVYYHHNRDTVAEGTQLQKIINADFLPRFNISNSTYKTYLFNGYIDDEKWVAYAIIVGMLNKFDYYASDKKDKLPVEIDGKYNGKYLGDYVLQSLNNKRYKLRPIQEYMLANKDKNLIVTASTGIGKTEAALLWADKQKLFYTLPLKISINAMYQRIKCDYGYKEDNVTLLHSDFISQLAKSEYDDKQIVLKYDATKRLSYPYTVCTVDQLFSFVYKYRGCEILLATLKYSKIVIDEIQSYEPTLIAKLIYGLKLITMAGGQFAIITATMPDVLLSFIKQEKIPFIAPEKPFLFDKIRHKIHYEQADDFDYDKIADCGRKQKVLVICNTVKKACEVWENLKTEYEDLNVSLLHSKFMRKDRRTLENAIMEFADNKDSVGIWVTTQLVEASLDIDFDVLFTEMCTADSLLQRMGRCYRKRNYSVEEPNVIVVDNKNGYGTVYKYKEIYDRSVEFLQQYNNCCFSEQEKIDYVNKVYNANELKQYSHDNKKGYYTDVRTTLDICKDLTAFDFTKDEAKKKFRNIISYKIIPKCIYNLHIDEFDKAKEILTKPKKYSFSDRQQAKEFVEDYSINLGSFDVRTKEKCNSLFDGLDYYTLDYKYNFDEDTKSGIGLEYDKDEEEYFI